MRLERGRGRPNVNRVSKLSVDWPPACIFRALQDLRAVPELTALVVNLTGCDRASAVLCEGGRLERMLRRAVAAGDELLFKVRRRWGCAPRSASWPTWPA